MALSDTLDEFAKRTRKSSGCAYMNLYLSLSKEDQKAIDKAWEKGHTSQPDSQGTQTGGSQNIAG
jgi:hypothetical protein